MSSRKRKPRKHTPPRRAAITLEHTDVQDLQRGMRKLLLLQQRRRALDRTLAQLTNQIRDQRNFIHSITAPKAANIGALPGANGGTA